MDLFEADVPPACAYDQVPIRPFVRTCALSEKSAADRARSLAALAMALERSKAALEDPDLRLSLQQRAELRRSIAQCERELRELQRGSREVSQGKDRPFWRKNRSPDEEL